MRLDKGREGRGRGWETFHFLRLNILTVPHPDPVENYVFLFIYVLKRLSLVGVLFFKKIGNESPFFL